MKSPTIVFLFIGILFSISCTKPKYNKRTLSSFEGDYSATALHYCWPEELTDCDTTFSTTVSFISDNPSLIVLLDYPSYELHLSSDEEHADPNEIRYAEYYNSNSSNGFLYNIDDNSFVVWVSSQGLGGGSTWSYKGLLE